VYAEAIKEAQQRPLPRWTWQQQLAGATTGALVSVFRSLAAKDKVKRARPPAA
jgi:hypothetical protein